MSNEITTELPPEDIVPEEVKKEKGLWEKTRKSLIERLNNWEDQRTWNEFYQTYWRLIFSVATKAGLTREEAFDVIQETIIAIANALARQGHIVVHLEATPDLPRVLAEADVDLIFNIAEGVEGRNREAQVPALCELLGVPYTGSPMKVMTRSTPSGVRRLSGTATSSATGL